MATGSLSAAKPAQPPDGNKPNPRFPFWIQEPSADNAVARIHLRHSATCRAVVAPIIYSEQQVYDIVSSRACSISSIALRTRSESSWTHPSSDSRKPPRRRGAEGIRGPSKGRAHSPQSIAHRAVAHSTVRPAQRPSLSSSAYIRTRFAGASPDKTAKQVQRAGAAGSTHRQSCPICVNSKPDLCKRQPDSACSVCAMGWPA